MKNIQFTLLIRINKQLHEFNFRQRSPSLYDADTVNERGDRYFFKMILDGSGWKIQGTDLAGWVTASEQLIHEALLKRES